MAEKAKAERDRRKNAERHAQNVQKELLNVRAQQLDYNSRVQKALVSFFDSMSETLLSTF